MAQVNGEDDGSDGSGEAWDLDDDEEEEHDQTYDGDGDAHGGQKSEEEEGNLGDWDEILNMEEKLFELGRTEGREIGAERERAQAKLTGQQKGAEFGLELGFYRGIVETLAAICKDPNGEIASALCIEGAPSDARAQALAGVMEKLAKPGVDDVLTTLDELLQAYPVGAGFDDDVHAKFLRIRAKFKVLEARVGLTFDITPPLSDQSAAPAQGSALDAASLEF